MKFFFCMFLMLYANFSMAAFDLKGSIFERIADEKNIDPILLYSVALVESARFDGKKSVSPWVWTIRSKEGPFYATSKKEAENKLKELLKSDTNIDIGMMQINYKWNSQYDAISLLDVETNLTVASDLLINSIKSAPGDLQLGIGRYHSWHEDRARKYGNKVISIYENLLSVE